MQRTWTARAERLASKVVGGERRLPADAPGYRQPRLPCFRDRVRVFVLQPFVFLVFFVLQMQPWVSAGTSSANTMQSSSHDWARRIFPTTS